MIYLLMLFVSALYAGLLATNEGRRIAKEKTVETVIFGTGLVLFVAKIGGMPWKWWRMLVLLFSFAGLPMALRSLVFRQRGGIETSRPPVAG